jgi:hypothetical protein|tara:strand:+ start:484 stop:657 length:174 start_codon:yes stop_codon:yes gene_type:complete
MLNELLKLEDKNIRMREIIPLSQHHVWKDSYLNKTARQVIIDINKARTRLRKKYGNV